MGMTAYAKKVGMADMQHKWTCLMGEKLRCIFPSVSSAAAWSLDARYQRPDILAPTARTLHVSVHISSACNPLLQAVMHNS
jgi:hypothetical protein